MDPAFRFVTLNTNMRDSSGICRTSQVSRSKTRGFFYRRNKQEIETILVVVCLNSDEFTGPVGALSVLFIYFFRFLKMHREHFFTFFSYTTVTKRKSWSTDYSKRLIFEKYWLMKLGLMIANSLFLILREMFSKSSDLIDLENHQKYI